MSDRDDFSKPVKRLLAERAGHHCSNPNCRALTSGPDAEAGTSINMGVAAHITAAAKGGSRYDPHLTNEQRSSAENGIWLCVRCSVLIDKKEEDYTVELLNEWKRHSEESARKGIEKPGTFASGDTNSYTVGLMFRYTKPSKYYHFSKLAVPNGYSYRESITFKPLSGDDLVPVISPTVPIVLDASLGPTPRSCIFVLCLENQGTGVERFARIRLRMKGSPIWKLEFTPSDRVTPLSKVSERTTSGIGGFSVANLMPGEVVTVRVYSLTSGPFDAEMYTESTAISGVPKIFDVRFGTPKLVMSPPDNPKFDEEQYPFK